MERLKTLFGTIPDAAKDIKLNVQSVLSDGALEEKQRFGIAIACAHVARNESLKEALLTDASGILDDAWIEDAKAAAALMAMNNVFYRFRHMIGKPSYGAIPAKLRMQRLANPATTKLDFELLSIAVSAIHGCEMCVRAHEKSLLELGASEAQVNDAVRIAATIYAAAIALELEATAHETP